VGVHGTGISWESSSSHGHGSWGIPEKRQKPPSPTPSPSPSPDSVDAARRSPPPHMTHARRPHRLSTSWKCAGWKHRKGWGALCGRVFAPRPSACRSRRRRGRSAGTPRGPPRSGWPGPPPSRCAGGGAGTTWLTTRVTRMVRRGAHAALSPCRSLGLGLGFKGRVLCAVVRNRTPHCESAVAATSDMLAGACACVSARARGLDSSLKQPRTLLFPL